MDNGTNDPFREILELIRSYIRRGSLHKLDTDPNTGEVKDNKSGEGTIPAELYILLEQMMNGDNKLPPEIAEIFRSVEKQMRDKEANLTPEQVQQLQAFYDKLKKVKTHRDLKKAEAEKKQLDKPTQDAIEAQRRMRQGLATRILEAWKKQNQQEEEDDGEGDSDDEDGESNPYPDESDLSDDSNDDSDDEADGDGEDSEGDSDGDGQENGQGQGDPYSDDSTNPEDFQKGLEQWLKQLEEETRQQEQEADKEQEAQAEQAAQDGEDGDEGDQNQPGLFPGDNADPVYELSTEDVDPKHLRIVQQAFSKLLARGKDAPTVLPRWNKKEFSKRQITGRPLRPARQPTLERKTVLFIIDNSGSMSQLEGAARAFAAALRKASGPRGADVVVATSYNGQYVIEKPSGDPQKECWFLNGRYMGHLPLPPSGAYDRKYQGPCWDWFITKELPRFCSPVHLVGIYGDNNGGHIWSFISNTLKQITCMWFNPSNQQGNSEDGPVVLEKNPFIADRKNLLDAKGYAKGDQRYEQFRGLSFLRVTSGDDIVYTLKRYIGN